MTIEILGLVFSMIIGTVGHFFYAFSNKNKVIGFLFAKDESVWEHLKLGITPILMWTIIELLTFNFNSLFFSKFIAILVFSFLLMSLYYGYKLIIKNNILFLDILIFYICLASSYYVSIKLLAYYSSGFILNLIGFIGLVAIIITYFIFNKKKPNCFIFNS